MLSEKHKVQLSQLNELGLSLDPVRFLNEIHGKSFELPYGKQYVTFDGLEELYPTDIVYHGTTPEGLEQIKKSGEIDVTKTSGRIFLTKYGKIAEDYIGPNGLIIYLKVEDVPGGITPPDTRREDGKFIYYGNMSGIGIVHQSIPFDKVKVLDFAAEIDEKEVELWRMCDVGFRNRLQSIVGLSYHGNRKLVNELFSGLVKRYEEIDIEKLDGRFPIAVIEAVKSELEKPVNLDNQKELQKKIFDLAELAKLFDTRRYLKYTKQVKYSERRV